MKQKQSAVREVIRLLSRREKRNLGLVMCVAFFVALIEVVGVSSIMPFIAVAANTTIIHTNPVLKWAFTSFGFATDKDFLVFLGLGVLVFLVVTSGFKAIARYVTVRFTSSCRHSLSYRLLETYLRQDFVFFLARSSSDLSKNVNAEVQTLVQGTIMNFVDAISVGIQLAFYITFLLVVSPLTTLVMLASIGSAYAGIFVYMRPTLKRLGEDRFQLSRDRMRIVNEALWGIKESRIYSVESGFLTQYKKPSERLARNESLSTAISDVPKFVLEAVAFSAILLYVLVSILETGSFQNAAATVGLFAYAGYRMIPAVQSLFRSLTQLRYSAPTVEKMLPEYILSPGVDLESGPTERLHFHRELSLENITYRYPATERDVLQGLSLTIPSRKTVGFVGSTGAGKTTLIDVLLGLLEVQGGEIKVDGKPLTRDNLRSWQANLGYVPQTIYLSNSTIEHNIAFGLPPEAIDAARVREVARLAQLQDFVEKELPEQYQTAVGERGVRLSGGQRQRIGIARALYRRPEVLVFDEATSALDNDTEEELMKAVESIAGSLTILMIAHRLTTLKKCDVIYVLEQGRVVDQGTYDELKTRHKAFQK